MERGRTRRRGTRGAQPPWLPLLCLYPLCSFVQSPTLPSCSFVPSCARSYSPHSPHARLYRPRCSVHTPCARSNPPPSPRARSFLLVLICTVPGALFVPPAHIRPPPRVPLIAAAAVAAATARMPSLAPWSVCARPAFAFLSVVPYL